MQITCCDSCKSINVEEVGTELIEIGHHWEEELSYPWKTELVKDYDYYKKYKCKDCGYEFKEKY